MFLAQVLGDDTIGPEQEATSTNKASAGNLFRYDAKEDIYIFNLDTKPLSNGDWRLRVELDDGTCYYAYITLR